MTFPVILSKPLDQMRLTQPFGVDWTGTNLYRKLGMLGHNGWDLRAIDGTPVYAAMGGEAYVEVESPPDGVPASYTSGYGINVKIRSRLHGLEVIYGHLKNTLVGNGDVVKPGQQIATADNTGTSSGSHLHFGIRRVHWLASGAGPILDDLPNGYLGWIDPAPFFADDVFALPVDKGYGVGPAKSEIAWYADAAYFWRKVGRLPSSREKYALLYGRWDLRAVLNDAMFPIWSEMTKSEAFKRGIIKKV